MPNLQQGYEADFFCVSIVFLTFVKIRQKPVNLSVEGQQKSRPDFLGSGCH